MKYWVTLFILSLAFSALAGPPEPLGAPEIPQPPEIGEIPTPDVGLDSARRRGLEESQPDVDRQLATLMDHLKNLEDSVFISDIRIGGDSIVIILDNDSVLAFGNIPGTPRVVIGVGDDDLVRFGSRLVIDELQVVNGDVVNFFGDVIVNGTVMGGVLTIGGNIYVGSTGNVRESAVALFGKVKQEPGGQIARLHIDFNEGRRGPIESTEAGSYRIMALVFLIIYSVWLVLSATFSSLLHRSVAIISETVRNRPWKSFFMGYLAYILTIVLFVALFISIVGIPLAALGLPLFLLAAMVISTTALSSLIGRRIVGPNESQMRTFLVGTLIFSGPPGLLFLLQLITGSMVLMIFSWIVIGIFIFLIVPLGLGAVLATRFGTRPPKTTPPAPTPQLSPQVQQT
jgi:hypothetical protein